MLDCPANVASNLMEYVITLYIALVLVQDALVAAIEEMRAMRSTVEQAEAAAQQAKKDAMNGGLDVLAEVKEMQAMLVRAREVNEMVCFSCCFSGIRFQI